MNTTPTRGSDDSVKSATPAPSDTSAAKITPVPKRGPPSRQAPLPKPRETQDTKQVASPILEAEAGAQPAISPTSPLAGRVRALSGHAVGSSIVGAGGEVQLINKALKGVLTGTSAQKLSREELDELATPPISPTLAKKERSSGAKIEENVDTENAPTPLLSAKVKTRPTKPAPTAPVATAGKGPPTKQAPTPRPPTPEETVGSGDEATREKE